MAQPTIASYNKSTIAASGESLVITGTNLNTAPVTAVTINGASVPFVVTNDTTLTLANTGPQEPGVAVVTATNPTGTATKSDALVVGEYVVPTRNNYVTHTGVFDTSGTTRFTNNIADQYRQQDSNLWNPSSASYPGYLVRLAKIKAVRLYNTRYNPDLAVVTF